MPNVDVFVSREKVMPNDRVKVKCRYVVDGVSRPERQHIWPDAFATYWAAMTADERQEMAERLSLEYVRHKIDRID